MSQESGGREARESATKHSRLPANPDAVLIQRHGAGDGLISLLEQPIEAIPAMIRGLSGPKRLVP